MPEFLPISLDERLASLLNPGRLHPANRERTIALVTATTGALLFLSGTVGIASAAANPERSNIHRGVFMTTLAIGPMDQDSIRALHLISPDAPVAPMAITSASALEDAPKPAQEIVDTAQEKTVDKVKANVRYDKDAFLVMSDADTTFGGGDIVFPNTTKAMNRAMAAVGHAERVCSDGKCYRKCDHLSGDIWGYEDFSGYETAAVHWRTAVKSGLAHKRDKEPPLGALLFWDSGPEGHVATYIGNGRVVTNFTGPAGTNVYIVQADLFEQYGYEYLGWAVPVYRGEKPGAGLS